MPLNQVASAGPSAVGVGVGITCAISGVIAKPLDPFGRWVSDAPMMRDRQDGAPTVDAVAIELVRRGKTEDAARCLSAA